MGQVVLQNQNTENEQLFGNSEPVRKGNTIMTDNEYELIKMIRENDNPEEALMTAAKIIIDFLKQHESSVEQAVVVLPELV